MTHPNSNEAIATVLSVFRERGHEEYHGEPISQLEHAVQTAQLAQRGHPNDPEFILAAFLHDFGHLCLSPDGGMDGYGVWNHEAIGAQALRDLGFSEKIARLVAGHVQAKRYLVSTDEAYYQGLSEASKITLEKQGGLLSPEEREDFEQDPLFDLHIALRRLDEQAKVAGQTVRDISWLKNLMHEHFSANFAPSPPPHL
jgi:predicted HD phosphohydrolase